MTRPSLTLIRRVGVAGTAAVAIAVPLTVSAPALAARPAGPSWHLLPTGSAEELRGLAPVNASVAWLGGLGGTVLRTTNGGKKWHVVGPHAPAVLEFRDVQAFDAEHAVIMAGGGGGNNRLYVTADDGRHWTESYRNRTKGVFFDCMTFFDRRHGLVLSDPVNGKFRILSTDDGGHSWRVNSPAGMPPARPGEFGFADSGTCLVSVGHRDAWFGSAGSAARVFRTTDGGRTWRVANTPMQHGPNAGIFSLAFRDRLHGLAIGGDFTRPRVAPRALALTNDGGRTWRLVGAGAPGQFRSGSTWVPDHPGTALAVGPTGSDISRDGGHTWQRFSTGTFYAVICTAVGDACWASGARGRAAQLVW